MKPETKQVVTKNQIEGRRDNPRTGFETQAVVTISSLPPRAYVIRDISPGGMFLVFRNYRTTVFELEQNRIEPGAHLEIRFLFWQEKEKHSCSLEARIVRLSKIGIGVAFLDYDPPETRHLREALSQRIRQEVRADEGKKPAASDNAAAFTDQSTDTAKNTQGYETLTILVKRFSNSLIYSYLSQIGQQLEVAANSARSRSEKARYTQAISQFSSAYRKLAEGFVDEILRRLIPSGGLNPAGSAMLMMGTREDLSLMRDDRLEIWLEIVEAIAETEQRTRLEVYQINKGFSHLAGFRCVQSMSPLNPEVLIPLLVESSRSLPCGSLAERAYLDGIADYVRNQLFEMYQKLSALFHRAGEGVLHNADMPV